jgi:hypothetical protein
MDPFSQQAIDSQTNEANTMVKNEDYNPLMQNTSNPLVAPKR